MCSDSQAALKALQSRKITKRLEETKLSYIRDETPRLLDRYEIWGRDHLDLDIEEDVDDDVIEAVRWIFLHKNRLDIRVWDLSPVEQ